MAERRKITRPIGQRNVGATARADTEYTRTVSVACKLPTGLILKTYHWSMEREAVPGGSREVKVAVQDPEVFHVHGNALPFGKMPSYPIVAGYAITKGIPKDFWDKWLEQNRELDLVKNELIFAYAGPGDAERAAKDHRGVKSGLEPVDPNNLPREFKKIKTATNNDADMEG